LFALLSLLTCYQKDMSHVRARGTFPTIPEERQERWERLQHRYIYEAFFSGSSVNSVTGLLSCL